MEEETSVTANIRERNNSPRLSESEIELLHHVDFTTASEWEVFIARLEEIILNWNLPYKSHHPVKIKLTNPQWETQMDTITFADVDFSLIRFHIKLDDVPPISDEKEHLPEALEEVMSSEMDFIAQEVVSQSEGDEMRPHILARYYGLRDFIVLKPLKQAIIQESKIKILLSSICIAINNKNCEIPIFVRSLQYWQNFYMGLCEGRGVRGEFEMVHLEKIPPQCRYLTGLLGLFKSKIGGGFPGDPVTVAARFTYVLNDWTIFSWSAEMPEVDPSSGELPEVLLNVPFGSICEPLASLKLHTYWPEILESVVVDSEAYSDFDPLEAPIWALSIVKAENPACLLTDYISEFIFHSSSTATTEELIGGEIGGYKEAAGDMLQPLSLLTESKIPTLSSMLTQYASRKSSSEGPINTKLLLPIIYYLFPDAESNPKHPYPDVNEFEKCNSQKMKTCNVGSLVWRLAIVIAHALHTFGGAKAAVHLWHEFCQELRYRWNNSHYIPGISPGFPDPKTCLLHQKLQMINCCIERRLKRQEEQTQKSKESEYHEIKKKFQFDGDGEASECSEDSDESEDEFFDCDLSEEEGEFGGTGDSATKKGGGDAGKTSKGELQTPCGRESQHGTLKLLKTGQPLYIPITQGSTPKTEDQLEEDAKILIGLGSDAEGSQLRAKLMSASLLSDMEAFKAANPGAVIEDFIRWYSPRDWVESEEEDEFGQKKGQLSERMMLPGNTWLEVWSTARGVPAKRQKRLFDETTEGEKALHLIESRDPGSAASMLLPVLAHAAVKKLSEEAASIPLPSLQSAVLHATKKLEVITRQAPHDSKRYQELTWEIGQIETLISQVRSLEHKICCEGVDPSLAWRLVSEPEVTLPGGPEALTATRVKLLFNQAVKNNEISLEGEPIRPLSQENQPQGSILKEANEREFILRVTTSRPTKLSRLCPQRLFAKVTKSDITMASLFSQDTTFF